MNIRFKMRSKRRLPELRIRLLRALANGKMASNVGTDQLTDTLVVLRECKRLATHINERYSEEHLKGTDFGLIQQNLNNISERIDNYVLNSVVKLNFGSLIAIKEELESIEESLLQALPMDYSSQSSASPESAHMESELSSSGEQMPSEEDVKQY